MKQKFMTLEEEQLAKKIRRSCRIAKKYLYR